LNPPSAVPIRDPRRQTFETPLKSCVPPVSAIHLIPAVGFVVARALGWPRSGGLHDVFARLRTAATAALLPTENSPADQG